MIDRSIGSYELTAKTLEPVSRIAVDAAEVVTGENALDLACRTGQRRHRDGVDPAP